MNPALTGYLPSSGPITSFLSAPVGEAKIQAARIPPGVRRPQAIGRPRKASGGDILRECSFRSAQCWDQERPPGSASDAPQKRDPFPVRRPLGQALVRLRGVGKADGFARADQFDVFEEGVRAPNAIKVATGSGVGLPLSRRIMHDLGRNLALVNKRNPTVFEVHLPKKASNDRGGQ